MAFEFINPNLPRGWVAQLNETLGHLKDQVDARDDALAQERDAAADLLRRAELLVAKAEQTVMELNARVARLERRK